MVLHHISTYVSTSNSPNKNPCSYGHLSVISTYIYNPIYGMYHPIYSHLGVSENSVPLNPMVLLIIIPIKWLFHWEYTQHFQTNPLITGKWPKSPWDVPPSARPPAASPSERSRHASIGRPPRRPKRRRCRS